MRIILLAWTVRYILLGTGTEEKDVLGISSLASVAERLVSCLTGVLDVFGDVSYYADVVISVM